MNTKTVPYQVVDLTPGRRFLRRLVELIESGYGPDEKDFSPVHQEELAHAFA